jgi:hypothetical protein
MEISLLLLLLPQAPSNDVSHGVIPIPCGGGTTGMAKL